MKHYEPHLIDGYCQALEAIAHLVMCERCRDRLVTLSMELKIVVDAALNKKDES